MVVTWEVGDDSMVLVLLGIIICLLILYSRKKSNMLLDELKLEIKKFKQEIEELRKDYITYIQRDKIKDKYKGLYNSLSDKMLPDEGVLRDFVETYFSLDELIKKWNEDFVNIELSLNEDIFNNIDGKSLDEQQRRAVVVDEMNNLVLAGAGSGKTLTISAKVKYLVDRKNVKPDEILLISFTRKAAEEMRERIANKLDIEIESMTFHKLGLDIITRYIKARPEVSDNLSKVINIYFKKNIYKDNKQLNLLLSLFGYYLHIPKDLSEFKNLGESYDFYKSIDLETMRSKVDRRKEIRDEIKRQKQDKQTIQGEIVKSLEELMIANFLFLNGIDYIYEYKYPYEQQNKYRKKYRPDFYLPEYDIYIEHFGISEDGRTPWLSKIEEKKYLKGMSWKRLEHKRHGTKLLETYSYYNKKGILLSELERILKREGVEFGEINASDLYKEIIDSKENRYFEEFIKLVSSFIQLFKSNGYGENEFDELKEKVNVIDNKFLVQRSNLFLDIVKPIYTGYEGYLRENGLIDFNDMINKATDIVKDGYLMFDYKYIIIDEYQDISMNRYKLIKAIRDRTNAKVMCVGDDWQSIYRFAGSDINLFTNFEKYFGYHELLRIEKTYRNSQELIDIAGNFVMKNPNQLRKNLKSDKRNSNPIRIINYAFDIYGTLKKVIDEIIYLYGENTKITVLGRNRFDIDFLKDSKKNSDMKLRLIESGNDKIIKYKGYPELQINYLTVHRSKGLEADNIIVINLENKLVGFPNKISDDPVLSLVLTDSDDFEFAEERRLFYVALTRTKNTTYLLAPDYKQSVFVEELMEEFDIKCEYSNETNSIIENPNCPKCQKGYLLVRKNNRNGSEFLGCSNYPLCDYQSKYLEIMDSQIECNSCGGYMVKRESRYGEFYGCTNYPYCQNKLSIEGDFSDIDYGRFHENNFNSYQDNIKIDEEKYGIDIGTRSFDELPFDDCYVINDYQEEYLDDIEYEIEYDRKVDEFYYNQVDFQTREYEYNALSRKDYYYQPVNRKQSKLEVIKKKSDYKVKRGQYDEEAIIFNKMIIKEGCMEVKYYFRLAECYRKLNKMSEALKVYEDILQIDKDNKIALYNIKRLRDKFG